MKRLVNQIRRSKVCHRYSESNGNFFSDFVREHEMQYEEAQPPPTESVAMMQHEHEHSTQVAQGI